MQREMPIEQRVIKPMFTLHDDVDGYINMRKEYLRDMDPSGYKTAVRLLESYEHWQMLLRTKWFAAAKEMWDKELAAKLEAEATDTLRGIMNDVGDNVKTSERITAAKALLGKAKTIGKQPVESKGRGRPSKEEVEGELKREAQLNKEEQEDLARIRLVENK
jgi:hypothetical protein